MIEIVPYDAKYQSGYKRLNEEWITKYFEMEESDLKLLDNPQENILDHGGHIFIALHDDEPVGTCALLKMDDHDNTFELAKMAVSPAVQGKGIGAMLARAVIEKAKTIGAEKIFLESHTSLQPALKLYKKLGFTRVEGHPSPYRRCNTQMELKLR